MRRFSQSLVVEAEKAAIELGGSVVRWRSAFVCDVLGIMVQILDEIEAALQTNTLTAAPAFATTTITTITSTVTTTTATTVLHQPLQ